MDSIEGIAEVMGSYLPILIAIVVIVMIGSLISGFRGGMGLIAPFVGIMVAILVGVGIFFPLMGEITGSNTTSIFDAFTQKESYILLEQNDTEMIPTSYDANITTEAPEEITSPDEEFMKDFDSMDMGLEDI